MTDQTGNIYHQLTFSNIDLNQSIEYCKTIPHPHHS